MSEIPADRDAWLADLVERTKGHTQGEWKRYVYDNENGGSRIYAGTPEAPTLIADTYQRGDRDLLFYTPRLLALAVEQREELKLIDVCSDANRDLQAQIDALDETHAGVVAGYLGRIAEQQREIAALKESMEIYHTDAHSLADSYMQAKATVAALTEDRDTWRRVSEKLEATIGDLRATVRTLQGDIERIQREREASEDAAAQTWDGIRAIRATDAEQAAAIARVTAERDRLLEAAKLASPWLQDGCFEGLSEESERQLFEARYATESAIAAVEPPKGEEEGA